MTVRRASLVAVIGLLGALVSAVPVLSQAVSDTISVVKENEDLSNIEMAIRLSEETEVEDVDTVLIGRDDLFADSMAAGVLQADYPLLLVPPTGPVPRIVLNHLAVLNPSRAILLGGEHAILPAVQQELEDLGLIVERREGESRFETAIDIAQTDVGNPPTVILARAFGDEDADDPSQAFADALAAGGMAAAHRWPILLTQTEVLTASTRTYLASLGEVDILLIGGEAAISAAVEDELIQMFGADHVERLAGADRFETALEIAGKRGDESAADADRVVLVQGEGEDAWAAGFAAARHSAVTDGPIVLAREGGLPAVTTEWLAGAQAGGEEEGTRATFAVDPTNVEGVVLTCVTVPEICEQARTALGLPAEVSVSFDPAPGSEVEQREVVRLLVEDPDGALTNEVAVDADCTSSDIAILSNGDAQVGIAATAELGPCTITYTLTYANGATQLATVTYEIVEFEEPPPPPNPITILLACSYFSNSDHEIHCDGSDSTSTAGPIVQWIWDCNGGFLEVDDGSSSECAYDVDDTSGTVTLTVVDDAGNQRSASHTITFP